MQRQILTDSLSRLAHWVEGQQFKGYDPYDGLNSPLVRVAGRTGKFTRIAATQILRRLPLNLRPLLLVPRGYNPKGIGLFLWSYAKWYNVTGDPRLLTVIDHLITLLEELRSTGYSGNCWGYNFDWQSRAFFIPRSTPTIVNSAFIGHALLDTFEWTGKANCLELAKSIGDFIVNDLNRMEEGDSLCFSYTPLDRYAVHNANLLGASILARLGANIDDSQLQETAMDAARYSLRFQRPDGSWFYAERAGSNWIDSFHTGFNLQALAIIQKAFPTPEVSAAIENGTRYYSESFFLADGTPKYYHDKIYPIDIHAPAQALVYFSEAGKAYEELTASVARWMIENMQTKKGYFAFRKGPYFTNRIPYMRWSQAWAMHGLTHLLKYGFGQE